MLRKLSSSSPSQSHSALRMSSGKNQILLLLLVSFFFVTVITTVQGAPPRIFGGKNVLRTTIGPTDEGNIPEEELELESLKVHGNSGAELQVLGHEAGNAELQPAPELATATTKLLAETSSAAPNVNAKRPENEEKPALSDNANSLKFSHHIPDGFPGSAVLFKKDHSPLHNANQDLFAHEKLLPIPNTNNGNHLHPQQTVVGASESGQGLESSHDESFLPGPVDLDTGLRRGGDERVNNNIQLDYTPQDIAEYVFWTGDERSVASAVNDFLQDGLVGREDAVRFLEDVKRELNSIRGRHSTSSTEGHNRQQQIQTFPHNNINNINNNLKTPGIPLTSNDYGLGTRGIEGYETFLGGKSTGDIRSIKRESYGSSGESMSLDDSSFTGMGGGLRGENPISQLGFHSGNPINLFSNAGPGGIIGSNGGINAVGDEGIQNPRGNLLSVEELDYDEIAKELRTVDAKMREFSLEEIIYRLAKDLFSESLKNSPTESIQTFSRFIEAQSAGGKIPKDLEKDVLEALVGALVDAVDEHGNHISKARGTSVAAAIAPAGNGNGLKMNTMQKRSGTGLQVGDGLKKKSS